MMSEQPAAAASDPEPPALVRIEQAGQLDLDEVYLVVHRTLEDDDGPYAVLRMRHRSQSEVVDVTARPGQLFEIPGVGAVLMVAVQPSTRELRGAVTLARP